MPSRHNDQLAMVYSSNTTNAPQTITVVFSGSPSFVWTTVDEFSGIAGLDRSGYLSQSLPGIGPNAVTTPKVTTAASGELI